MTAAPDHRLHFLDGLRGWGALAVVLFHVFVEGFAINEHTTATLRRVFMFNGALAVWVFFLVSGFSLAVGYCRSRNDQALVKIALGRYVRLAVPIFCAVLLLYLFFALGMVPPADQRLPKFQGFLPLGPGLWDTVRFALFDVFFAYNESTTLIGPLWTMPFELWGSCLVLGLLFVVGRLDRRFYVFAAAALVAYFIHPIYAAFVLGLVLAEVHTSEWWRTHGHRFSTAAMMLALPGVYAASLLPKDAPANNGAYFAVGALLTIACIFSRPLSALLSGPVSRYLGRISFPLYLIHGPLMLAYGNNAYRWVAEPTDVQKVLLNLSTVAVSIACATLLAPTDRWGIAAAKRFSGYLMGPRGAPVEAEIEVRSSPR
jgi:peptidoglycan/LPS O-acetylase OafA/YrhL